MPAPDAFVDDQEEVIVTPTTKSARLNGTWTMFWGADEYDFVAGQRYDIPADLYAYLLANHNVLDTL